MGNGFVIEEKARKGMKIVICFILFLYPILLFEADVGGVPIQTWMLYISIAALALCYASGGKKKKKNWRASFDRCGIIAILLALYECIRIVGNLFFYHKDTAYRQEIMIISFVVLYFLIAARPLFSEKYFHVVLFAGLVVFSLLIIHYLSGSGADRLMEVMLKDNRKAASFAVLVCTIALCQYCRSYSRYRSIFFGAVAFVGFLILFLNKNAVSIWLMLSVFIAIPIVFHPTVELVKRDMQMLFLYLFLFGNMGFLTTYTGLIKGGVAYSLDSCIYLNVAIVIGGIFFFRMWEKIPPDVDIKRLVIKRLGRKCFILLKICAAGAALVFINGANWKELPDGMGMSAIKAALVPVVEEVQTGKSAFYLCLEGQGIIGSLLILALCICMVMQIYKNHDRDWPVTGVLTMVAGVFFAQLLFWGECMNTLPLYVIFVLFAVFIEKGRAK